MTSRDATAAAFFEQFAEFCHYAARLEIGLDEQVKILNVEPRVLHALVSGDSQMVSSEVRRRLSYALPLMRRLAASLRESKLPANGDRVLA